MATFNSIIGAILIAFFIFASYKLVIDDDIDDTIKDQIKANAVKHPIATSLFVKSLDEITPSFDVPVPFGDGKINDIIFVPGWLHIIIIIILIIISGIFMRIGKVPMSKQLLVFLFMIILGYVIASIIGVITYNVTGKIIGFTAEEATNFRAEYSNKFDNVFLPLVLIAGIGALAILKTVFGQVRKNR